MSDTFLTVPTTLRCMFRMADGPDSPRLYSGAAPSVADGLREELLASVRHQDLMVRFLAEMDRKLDTVIALLQRESLASAFPREGYILEISGAGLVLECPDALQPGDCLELLLLLEQYPLQVVSVLSRVEGSHGERAATGQANKAYAISYIRVEAEDREAIIRFVFREERKRIRQQKNEI